MYLDVIVGLARRNLYPAAKLVNTISTQNLSVISGDLKVNVCVAPSLAVTGAEVEPPRG